MQISQYAYVAMLAAVALLCPAVSAEQFSVHRAADASSAHDASALAVVTVSPFDDGVLVDGLDHYYLVRDESEMLVRISLHKNYAAGAVRIAFDDGNDLAAPVDPARSSVTVAPETVPADGVTMSLATIIPRDADGIPLGSGLLIQVDIGALSPGFPCGPLEDRGDGWLLPPEARLNRALCLAGTGNHREARRILLRTGDSRFEDAIDSTLEREAPPGR